MRWFLIPLVLLWQTCVWGAPQVAVTLKPIHSLVAGIMEGVATPTLLLPDGASPHTFQLKPSTLLALNKAELIVWVGPNLETFMQKPLSSLHPRFGRINLMEIPGIQKLPQRHTREWQHADESHEHNHETYDPHIWLSVKNAEIIVHYITDYLANIDPLHREQYRENEKKMQQRLETLRARLHQELTPVQTKPFLVYHDGYQYLEKEFALNSKGTMITNPHVPLSAHGLQAIQKLIASQNIHCVFRETEFNDTVILNSLSHWKVKVAELDPLGNKIPAGPENYEKTMLKIGETLEGCLQ
jgi:zinc transport system substrate-binding protein